MQNCKIEEGIKPNESTPVARRLSTPYHGLPSVVDYDPETGFVTFGQLIKRPPPVVHPRRYVPPKMPTMDCYPGVCYHDFCLSERRRLYGLAVPENPVGLPWASGRLKHLPGHAPGPRAKRSKRDRRNTAGNLNEELYKSKRVERAGVMDELIYFYKIVLLAGSLVSEARREKYGEDGPSLRSEVAGKGEAEGEAESAEAGGEEPPEDKTSTEVRPEPAEVVVGEALTEGGDAPAEAEVAAKGESELKQKSEEQRESVAAVSSGEALANVEGEQ